MAQYRVTLWGQRVRVDAEHRTKEQLRSLGMSARAIRRFLKRARRDAKAGGEST